MRQLRLVLFTGLALVLAVGLAAPLTPAQAAPPAQDTTMARVRFVHASVDAPSLDVYLDGGLVAGDMRGVVEYLDVPPGTHTFSFRAAGGAEDLAATAPVTLEAGQRVTIAAINSFATLEARAYPDVVTAPARNAAQVKVIHAVSDAPPVTITVGEQVLAADLPYGEASETSQVYAGTYDLVIAAADGTVLATDAGRAFGDNRAYTFFVIGKAAAKVFRVIPVESSVLQPDNTSTFRFANMAQGVGSLTVHINKEPAALYPEVPLANVTNYFVTGSGPHLFEVYPLGSGPQSGPPLASGVATIGPNESVLFVARGTAGALEVVAYKSDTSPVPASTSRLHVINLAAGNPPIQVERMEGGTLFDSIEVFGEASRTVAAGTYNIRFKDPAAGTMLMEQGGIQVLAGTVTVLVAFDDDPADPLINAVSYSIENVQQYASIRWAHLNVWGPPVDVYMDGAPVSTGMFYPMVTDYMLYPPKVYTLAVYRTGDSPTTAQPLSTLSIELTGDNFPRTIYIYGAADQAQLGVAPDNLELLPQDTARVRFINTAIDSAAVAVTNPTDGSTPVPDLQFGASSANVNVAEGVYTFNFVREADGGPIESIQGLTVEAGKVYTVVLAGVYGEQPGTEVLVFEAVP